MRRMWGCGGLSWWQVLARVWREIWIDQVPGRCAELAYYFLFSVFPLLLFLTSLLGYLAGPESRLRHVLFVYVGRFAPTPEVPALLAGTLDQVTTGRGSATLSLSLLVALWVASTGMLALGRTLNSAYGVEETRPWWWRRLVAVGLTIGFSVLTVCALSVLLYGHQIGEALANALGVAPVFVVVWHVVRWPMVLAFVLLSFEVVYNYAPNLGRGIRRGWGTPGAVFGVCVWLVVSFGLRLYLSEVHGYASTYGPLGAVFVMLLWFYLTALAFLVGGEVNSVIWRQLATLRQRSGGASGARGGAGGARGARPAAARGSAARRAGQRRGS